jgi:hypothetical protein
MCAGIPSATPFHTRSVNIISMWTRGFALCAVSFGHASEVDEGLVLLQARAAVVVGGASNANASTRTTHGDDNNAGPLKTRYNNKCMDYNYNNHNVYMHGCHGGSNQQWYMVDEKLTTKRDDTCLDMNYNTNNVYMHSCHGGQNQQWFFDGEDLKTRYDPSKCLDYNYHNGNIYMNTCHGGRNQQYYWSKPVNPAFASRIVSRHGEKCMDYNLNTNNVYFHACHDGKNQKFILDGTLLKTLSDNKCVDYNYNDQNVYMNGCNEGKNQQWHFEGEALKTNYNSKCLDLNTGNGNVYMHNCHGGDNQKFYIEGVMNGLDHDEVKDEIAHEADEQRACEDWCNSKKHRNNAARCGWKSCAGCKGCPGWSVSF